MLRKMRSMFVVSLVFLLVIDPLLLFAQGWDQRRGLEPLSPVESFRQIAPETSQPTFSNTMPSTGWESSEAKGRLLTSPVSTLNYQIHILGEVKQPGTYRITASDRLSEVLLRAGDATAQGSIRNIQIRRDGEKTKLADLLRFQLFGSLADNPYLLDNDVVYVPLKTSTIQIVGAVKRPRVYELKSEKTLADVVALGGGFSIGVAKGSPIRLVRFKEGKKELLEIQAEEEVMQSTPIVDGDIIVVPHVITEANKFDYNVAKLPGDNIFYPSYEDRVFVLGGVGSPGAYAFSPFYRIPQYLSLAGGTTKMATGKIFLLSPNGKRKRIRKNNIDTVIINPGNTVLVDERRIPPEGWVSLVMGIAGFGLSTTATILALTQR